MMSYLSLPPPTLPSRDDTFLSARARPSVGEMAQRGAIKVATLTRDAFATRLRADVCCTLAAAHLVRGYFTTPSAPDVTVLLGNALWEAAVPSRSAFALNGMKWVVKQCPIFPDSLVQTTALLARYTPAVELFLTDPLVEVAVIGTLLVVPVISLQARVPTRYQTAVQLGIASVFHVALSTRTAKSIIGPP